MLHKAYACIFTTSSVRCAHYKFSAFGEKKYLVFLEGNLTCEALIRKKRKLKPWRRFTLARLCEFWLILRLFHCVANQAENVKFTCC